MEIGELGNWGIRILVNWVTARNCYSNKNPKNYLLWDFNPPKGGPPTGNSVGENGLKYF
jgi:hypothetical protein